MKTASGVVFIVSTPIGNLGDITQRALETLKSVDIIYSENTKQTQKLLNKFKIETPQSLYTDQRHKKVVETIKSQLDSGKNIALVSDSGTPIISDPGYKLVATLRKENYKITVIPGPSAVVAALTISGLPTDKFVFLGFLPKSKNKRRDILTKYGELDATLTVYESPYRLGRLLQEVMEVLGDRYVSLAKDLTKIYEDVKVSKVSEIISELPESPKGEYVVLISRKGFEL